MNPSLSAMGHSHQKNHHTQVRRTWIEGLLRSILVKQVDLLEVRQVKHLSFTVRPTVCEVGKEGSNFGNRNVVCSLTTLMPNLHKFPLKLV